VCKFTTTKVLIDSNLESRNERVFVASGNRHNLMRELLYVNLGNAESALVWQIK
jgi:hypothetical protein